MILFFPVSLVFVFLLFFSISKFRSSNRKSPWIVAIVVFSAVILLIGGVIYHFVDYYSDKHWISIVPIIDASAQNKGMAGFSLPKGSYLIMADYEASNLKNDDLIIRYSVNVPQEGLNLEKEKTIRFDLGIRQYHLESFTLNKNRSNGTISVEILKPPKNKIAVKLATNRYLDL